MTKQEEILKLALINRLQNDVAMMNSIIEINRLMSNQAGIKKFDIGNRSTMLSNCLVDTNHLISEIKNTLQEPPAPWDD